MVQSSTPITLAQLPFYELLQLIGIILGVIISVTTIGKFMVKSCQWIQKKLSQRTLLSILNGNLYAEATIRNSLQYYIEPDCQSVDPSGGDDPKYVVATRERFKSFMDSFLNQATQYKYLIILADSGMGKSTFLLNYYARHLIHHHEKFDISLIPLGIPNADQRIAELSNQQKKVLFLDAFDEDVNAISNHSKRMNELILATNDFYKVVISCRTQFFPSDEELPNEIGIIKRSDPRPAGISANYAFHKIYLAPFSDNQIHAYLKKRYLMNFAKRKKANIIVKQVPNLLVRPMLLTHIDTFINSKNKFYFITQLYKEIVNAWLQREEDILLGVNKQELQEFSENLSYDLVFNRNIRKGERIPGSQLEDLAKNWNIRMRKWQLTGRSLLNRDAVGNYKFAHRSIMEYLCVLHVIKNKDLSIDFSWTDQMIHFLKNFFIMELLQIVNRPLFETNLNTEVSNRLRKLSIELLHINLNCDNLIFMNLIKIYLDAVIDEVRGAAFRNLFNPYSHVLELNLYNMSNQLKGEAEDYKLIVNFLRDERLLTKHGIKDSSWITLATFVLESDLDYYNDSYYETQLLM